jgi:C1A family cysteine protease
MTRTSDNVDLCEDWDGGNVAAALPSELSWRDTPAAVGPVRDQVACGSCWAFENAEAIKSQLALATGVNRLHVGQRKWRVWQR